MLTASYLAKMKSRVTIKKKITFLMIRMKCLLK